MQQLCQSEFPKVNLIILKQEVHLVITRAHKQNDYSCFVF